MKEKVTLLLGALIMVFAITACALHPSDYKDSEILASKVDEIFVEWDKIDSPGCALAVINDGEIIYKRGYGMANLEHSIPISTKTPFYMCSLSKQFTAMCILLLSEQGKLSSDDDIRKYIPEIPEYDHIITIQHLLHHTSGIRDYLDLRSLAGKNYADSVPEEDVLNLLSRQKALNFKPGDQYMYSNSGYILLSMVIKRVSGKSLREFSEENIFKPLGMLKTQFHDDRTKIIKDRADGYFRREDGSYGLNTTSFDLVGDGGLYSTTEDLFLWDQNFYQNKLGNGGKELIERMILPGKLNNGETLNYAFGLLNDEYKGLRMIRHGGSFIGFKGEFIRFPEQKFSVVILANLASINPRKLSRQVIDLYLADQFESGQPKTEARVEKVKRSDISIDPSIYDTFTGKYQLESGAVIIIAKENGRLKAHIESQPKAELIPESETHFFLKNRDAQISFRREVDGKVTNLVLHQNKQNLPAKKIKSQILSLDQLEKFEGEYYSIELQVTYRVVLKEKQLFIRVRNIPPEPLIYFHGDRFTVAYKKVTFLRNNRGKITSFTLDTDRVKNLKFVKKEMKESIN